MTILKVTAITVGVLLIAGCAVGWVTTYQTLGDTELRLDDAQADVVSLEQDLQDTRDSLAETQAELQETVTGLSNTQSELADQINETDKYLDLYEETRDELEDTENELESLAEDLKAVEQRNESLEAEIAELQEQLDLYRETLGISVFSDEDPPYRSGDVLQLTLTDNISAEDPTWEELLIFLREDKTDKHLYVPGEFECGNFAQELHDNAEEVGIRTAFVAIHYKEGVPHAINAFRTTDQGLVYIDVTGSPMQITLSNLDKQIIITEDLIYTSELLFPEMGWSIPQDNQIVTDIEIYW